MSPKTLEPTSDYAKYDVDGDGVVSDEEMNAVAKLEELAVLSGETASVVGFVDRSVNNQNIDAQKRGIANAAALIQGGDVKGIYHKCFLPNYSVFDEARYFDQGTDLEKIFWFEDIGVGINICEDVWIGDGPAEAQVAAGASIIININASPFDVSKSVLSKIRALLISSSNFAIRASKRP